MEQTRAFEKFAEDRLQLQDVYTRYPALILVGHDTGTERYEWGTLQGLGGLDSDYPFDAQTIHLQLEGSSFDVQVAQTNIGGTRTWAAVSVDIPGREGTQDISRTLARAGSGGVQLISSVFEEAAQTIISQSALRHYAENVLHSAAFSRSAVTSYPSRLEPLVAYAVRMESILQDVALLKNISTRNSIDLANEPGYLKLLAATPDTSLLEETRIPSEAFIHLAEFMQNTSKYGQSTCLASDISTISTARRRFLRLASADNGIGIPRQMLRILLSKGASTGHTGGQGTFLAAEYATKHGGFLQIRSAGSEDKTYHCRVTVGARDNIRTEWTGKPVAQTGSSFERIAAEQGTCFEVALILPHT
ncbi:MAG: hypothetical protein TR69_WS6001000460 [candidate division WS6 bacterium OLB20]|uniref:Histidine kinase/HSP90-like ATPase domain-containing protein n=1 Tax=candidate division WS6 bacterium OLB20 TaxID=1617426 RepID=A0A136LXV1_9BACT|nr:MAG: hypothetical protein TR69_WS6001000460 [candidate division WS6 bacterium OLB20]